MILTAMGLKAIETIQAGDQVIATNPDTFQTEEKTVVETYINKTTCIVKIIIQNEVICTTMNHPFYVKGQGFLAAGKLSIGDEIMNASGGSYPVEGVELEEKQETVYNFQVEDYHTYYVGENSILVHNDCPEGGSSSTYVPRDADGNPISLNKQTVNGQDIPLPDPAAQGRPHTVLGGKASSKTGEVYRQTATFPESTWPTAGGKNVPWSEVHWGNHGRGDHLNPHQHIFEYNPDKGGWIRGEQTYFNGN